MTAPEQEQTKGPWWLALRVIDEPAEVFRQLAARPRALVPIMLLAIVAAIMALGTPAEPIREMARQQMEAAQERAPDQITDADIEERAERAASLPSRLMFMFAGTVIYYLISFVVVAAVLMLIFGAMGSEPVKFKQEFAIVTHAFVPMLLGILLLVALARFFGLQQLQLSLGFLFDEDAGYLYHLANRFTLFGAWWVALLALGNQIRVGAKGIGTPLAIVGGLWVLVNLGFAGLASVFGGLAG